MSNIDLSIRQSPLIIKTEQKATAKQTILREVLLEESKHSHWLQCLDSDNFSMFIKTWFAFLATVHQLVLSHASEKKKNELELAQGDKPFLKEFKTFYNSIELNKISVENILKVFQISRKVIFDIFPQYYYTTYFKKTVPNDIFLKEPYKFSIRRGLNVSYKLDVKLSEKDFVIGVLFVDEKTFRHMHEHYVCIKLEICKNQDIHLLANNSNAFYDFIHSELNKTLVKNIKAPLNSPDYKKAEETVSAIELNINQTLKTSNCYDIIFVPWIVPLNPIDSDLKEWFFDFCYKLRNILFHHIIDPFDSNWSFILKYSHQGLRELLLENIRLLKESEVSQGQ